MSKTNTVLRGTTWLPYEALVATFFAPLLWFAEYLWVFFVPSKYATTPVEADPDSFARSEKEKLFPSINQVLEPKFDEKLSASDSETCPQPCSTGLTSRFLPFKNAKGEIEWAFADDFAPGSELDAFKAQELVKSSETSGLSPVTSGSSSAESIISAGKNAVSPQINTPSSSSSEDDKNKFSEGGELGDENFPCPECSRLFKKRGYLTRHMKKHASQKAYKCPFHQSSMYLDDKSTEHRCHPSGGFSRRDTYKTHLKSRHFRYPEGTVIKDRNMSPGNCSMCGEWFGNSEIWCEIHIEGAECKYLPPGFKGKSRIKIKMKKELNKMMRGQKQKKKMALDPGAASIPGVYDLQSPNLGTPTSITTPVVGTSSFYDYSNSPVSTTSSSATGSTVHRQQPHQQLLRDFRTQHLPTPMVLHELRQDEEDFDDEYCLDTDQLTFTPMVMPQMFLQHVHTQ